jgi:hypothetical protein
MLYSANVKGLISGLIISHPSYPRLNLTIS